MNEENKNTVVKVGDKLAFDVRGLGWQLSEVVKISKTGRITCKNEAVLDPDLRLRGIGDYSAWPYYARIITPEIIYEYTRQQNLKYLQGYKWAAVENDKLMQIVELLKS